MPTDPTRPPFEGWRLCALLVLVGAVLTGCAPREVPVAVPAEVPEAFSEPGTEPLPDRWWTSFDSPPLSAAVEGALASNFDVRAAWARLQAAEAVVARESGALLPQLEAVFDAGTEVGGGGTSEGGFGVDGVGSGLYAAYEVDLWGRIEAAVEAEAYRAAAAGADYRTAALTISAEIVRTWFAIAAARRALALLDEQLETNLDVLVLIQNRFEAGQVLSVDVLRQRQLVEATRAQRAEAVAVLETLAHELAVLLGRPPQEDVAALAAVPDSLPPLPPLPETGLPVALVQRRPDVQQAFYGLRAADRDLAAAISARYPRLTLTASAASVAGGAGDVFRNWALSVGGELLAPIFYGGALRAEVERVEAVTRQRLYEYGQAVLVAFREVEDALVRERQQAARLAFLEDQIELAELTYERLQAQYFNGSISYLDVLVTLNDLQALRREFVSAQLQLVEVRVALYRALAGSFETPLEDAAEAGAAGAADAP